MAETMSFELVSPERRLAFGEVEMVTIPGMEGDIGALPGHAPFLTTLRPGLLVVTGGEAAGEYFVTGGFAEITPDGVAVLAEETMTRVDLSREFLDRRISAARVELDEIDTDDHHGQRTASQRLNDLLTAVEHMF
ncbi:MAG: ATP synthase F1 subunit epsilon [Paracoccaceae bacterium]